MALSTTSGFETNFYPRPPRGGRHTVTSMVFNPDMISIHALREEGDGSGAMRGGIRLYFYPRPPRGGRHLTEERADHLQAISIHALREEGDGWSTASVGRAALFLSTPSARRATSRSPRPPAPPANFYPRPPRGGRLHRKDSGYRRHRISIHALREEGDPLIFFWMQHSAYFYPRPPRGGRQ